MKVKQITRGWMCEECNALFYTCKEKPNFCIKCGAKRDKQYSPFKKFPPKPILFYGLKETIENIEI